MTAHRRGERAGPLVAVCHGDGLGDAGQDDSGVPSEPKISLTSPSMPGSSTPAHGLAQVPPLEHVRARRGFLGLGERSVVRHCSLHAAGRGIGDAGKGFLVAIRLNGVILPAPAAIPATVAYLYGQGGGR